MASVPGRMSCTPGTVVFDPPHDGFEDAQVERGVVVEHGEPGGAVLRLAQLQAARDAVAARGGGAGEDEPAPR